MFLLVRSNIVSPVGSSRWGGGRPPAPSGQMGIMVSFVLVLHWQEGDGFLWFHAGLCKMLLTTGGTSGCSHSEVLLLQGNLEGQEGRNETQKHRVIVISSHNAHPSGSPSMHRVPRPGGFNKRAEKCFILGSYGLSLLIQSGQGRR